MNPPLPFPSPSHLRLTFTRAVLVGATINYPAIREKVDELIAAQDPDGFDYGLRFASVKLGP
jgi:hypothetical protein